MERVVELPPQSVSSHDVANSLQCSELTFGKDATTGADKMSNGSAVAGDDELFAPSTSRMQRAICWLASRRVSVLAIPHHVVQTMLP